jgi:hypothetical protein
MATTTNFPTSSPHSVVLEITGDGLGGSTAIARADILLACAEGPLKALLTRTTDWTVFNLGAVGARKLRVREVVDRAQDLVTFRGTCSALNVWWTADTLKVLANGECQMDIRLQQSERL